MEHPHEDIWNRCWLPAKAESDAIFAKNLQLCRYGLPFLAVNHVPFPLDNPSKQVGRAKVIARPDHSRETSRGLTVCVRVIAQFEPRPVPCARVMLPA